MAFLAKIAGPAMAGMFGLSLAEPLLGDIPIFSDILGGLGDIPFLGDLTGLSAYSNTPAYPGQPMTGPPQGQPMGGQPVQSQVPYYYPQPQPSSGMGDMTLPLIIGGVGVVAVLLLIR
jgi:hypothetical protein